MEKYILLTRISTDSLPTTEEFHAVNERVSERLKQECPDVKWLANYTTLGPYDYLDIFEAPDNEVAARVALIVRAVGHAHTEIWPAVTWERFEKIADSVSHGPRKRPSIVGAAI